MAVADKYTSQLEKDKAKIAQSYMYFKENYKRFHEYRRYLWETTISEDQKTVLNDQGKPVIEFNVLPAYVSRLLGEFAKHEPSIEVRPASGVPVDANIIELVEGHIRHINYEANKNSCDYEVYKDILSGGFSVLKVYTDWESAMSFNQVIIKERAFDPTLCGFDPMARHSHKADGQYCFELIPKTYEDFVRQYPGVDVERISYNRDIEGFNWSYENNQDGRIILLAEYFEKQQRRRKIVKLANGRVMTAKDYEKFQAFWEKEGFIEQIPKVVGKSRMSDIEVIIRKLIIDTETIEAKETDYSYLPLVFVDGNSIILTKGFNNDTYQFTMPYIYHARGIQDLKNFAGQCLGNYLDNLIQHKFIVKKEAIPQEQDYLDALTDIQHSSTIVVQAYSENNPDKPIPEPIREVVNVPAPPEVMGTFTQTDNMAQMIMGTFDASLGINDNQLSGVAVIESATQSNAVAFPFIKGYLQAETQCANIIIDLLPKYKRNQQILPVVDKEGKRDYQPINGQDQPKLDYDKLALSVEVSAGVNYAIAKNKALTQIFAMMQASPKAAEFFSTEGFPIILDNMEFHGSDIAKEKAEQWLEKQAQQPPQPNPLQLKAQADMAKIQQKNQEMQMKSQMHQSQLQVDILKLQQDQARLMHDLQLSRDENYRENTRAAVDHSTKMAELHLKAKDQHHKHNIDKHKTIQDYANLQHNVNQDLLQNTSDEGGDNEAANSEGGQAAQ